MNKIYLLLALFVAGVFTGCTKDETDGMPTVEVGAIGNVTKDASTDTNFDPDALNTMDVKFDLNVIADDEVKRVAVTVDFNDGSLVGVYEVLGTKTAKIDVTMDRIKDALVDLEDVDLLKGSKFSFYVSEIEMLDGRIFANDSIATNQKNEDGSVKYLKPINAVDDFTSSSSVFNMKVDYYIACEFDISITTGSYHVISDADNWDVEGDVTITADPSNPLKVIVTGMFEMEGGAPNDNELVLFINPDSFEVTGPKSLIGSTAPWGDYADYSYEPKAGLFTSCDGGYELSLAISVDVGGWGAMNFKFSRN